MIRLRSLSTLTAVLLAAGSNLAAQTTAYVGASVWDGTGASIIRNATMVVEDGSDYEKVREQIREFLNYDGRTIKW